MFTISRLDPSVLSVGERRDRERETEALRTLLGKRRAVVRTTEFPQVHPSSGFRLYHDRPRTGSIKLLTSL